MAAEQGGAPPKLTPDRNAAICDAIRAGVRPETAAVYNGVGARSYYRWMQLGRAGDATPSTPSSSSKSSWPWPRAGRDVLLIGEGAKSDWRAAAWRLERRLPKVYGKRERPPAPVVVVVTWVLRVGSNITPHFLTPTVAVLA